VPSRSLESLAASVTDVQAAGDPGYDTVRERVTWNKRLDKARRPEAIVAVRSAAEAAATLRFAAANGLKVSPRGSGHHYEAAALRDGGMMLDLGGLDFIEVDAENGTARIGVGVRGDKLIARLAEQGFAFPVGHCVDVGLSGYILSGGFGWNAGEWGAACANVTAIEMVTAAGEVLLASADENADLFWAARGHGPGFFAAITAYHLRLHPLPPVTYAWRGYFAATCAPALADWLNAAVAATHPEVEIGCFLLTHWDTHEPAVILRAAACADSEGEARDRLGAFASPPATAEAISAPCGEVVAFPELFRMSPMPDGKRVAADHLWSDAAPGDLLMAVHDLPAPSRHATIDIVAFGGGSRVDLGDGALTVGGGTGAGIYALWDDPADDEANRAWVRDVDTALAPYRTGRYVGEADLTAGPERRPECFTPAALERLEALRREYDPEGLFPRWP